MAAWWERCLRVVMSLFKKKEPCCPGINLRWNMTPDDIRKETDVLMVKTKGVYDSIAKLKTPELDYNNVIKAVAEVRAQYSTRRDPLVFLQHASPNKDVREASVAAEKKLAEFEIELSMREDILQILVAADTKFGESLKTEAKLFLRQLITLGKRNGLHLSKEIQSEIKKNKKIISGLCTDFINNLSKENTQLEFTAAELEGLPPDVIKGLEKTSNGKHKVSLKNPHYHLCMKFIRNPNVRMKLQTAYDSRCLKQNMPIIDKLLSLRQKQARLLTFPTHAAFVLKTKMAKTPERVTTFLTTIRSRLEPLKKKEMALLLQYKKEECSKYGFSYDNKINLWDLQYYMAHIEEKNYSVNHSKLREYFPLAVVLKGVLNIFEGLLSLKFNLMEGPEVWHPDVTLYKVNDKASGSMIGYFYLDLHPREGKLGHTKYYGLQLSCIVENGVRQIPVAAILANFSKPVKGQPSLLTHNQVVTFLHEFGHLMHHICCEVEFELFSGPAAVEDDFVETPSQLMENWCWEQESLVQLSSHYKNGSAIPGDLMTSLLNSRKANAGILNLIQIVLATFDQNVHTANQAKPARLLNNLHKEILGISLISNTNPAASLAHLAGDRSVMYYGFLWSEMFSADMFNSRFKAQGIMNSKIGLEYRNFILKPGGSVSAEEIIRKFLGREPTPDAFLKNKGLQ